MLGHAGHHAVSLADIARCGFDGTSDDHTEPDAVADSVTDTVTDPRSDARQHDGPAGDPGPRDGRARVQLDDRRVPGTR